MARITYGPLITELAGSIGGVTFQRNTSGPIAKLKTNPPVNPRAEQSLYQRQMAILVSYWPTLSQANKDLWNAYAIAHDHTTPWGETKTLSGYQWFLSCNLANFQFDVPILDAPAGWVVIAPPDTFVIQTSSTYIRLYWSGTQNRLYYLFLYVTLPLRQSSLKLRRSLFYLSFLPWNGVITYWDFTSLYESFANITWSTFYASSNCSIIARVKRYHRNLGLSSSYTSAIIKIG